MRAAFDMRAPVEPSSRAGEALRSDRDLVGSEANDNTTGKRWPARRPERGGGLLPPPCRIYRPSRSVMQAGAGRNQNWLLEFEPWGHRSIEPLMGWTSSNDPYTQVRLQFPSKEAAVGYACSQGLDYRVIDLPPKRIRPKSYVETILGRPMPSQSG